MNKLILFLLLVTISAGSAAQKTYFIYLQSENNQPFRARLNEKVFTSSDAGFLILSKLPDTTLKINISFVYERAPEQEYNIHMNRRDRGFVIRHFGEKGWGISDLQDQSIQYSTGGNKTGSSGKASVMNTSAFAAILAKASDDPSIMEIVLREPVQDIAKEKPKEKAKQEVVAKEPEVVAKKEIPTESKTTDIAKQDPPQPKKEAEVKTEVKTEVVETKKESNTGTKPQDVVQHDPPQVKKEPEVKKEVAEAKRENNTETKPRDIAKNDPPQVKKETAVKEEESAKKTTDPPVIKEEKKQQSPTTENAKSTRPESITEKVQEKPKAGEKPYKKSEVTKAYEARTVEGHGVVFIDKYEDGKKDTVSIVIPESKPIVTVKETPKEDKKFLEISSEKKAGDSVKTNVAVVNKCGYIANNNDFYKLRKDMAAAEGDEAMLDLARKYFKLKCYTVAQVKALGSLFLEDEGKYQFYDAVYRHTTDPENFNALETELKDPYYINRFKAMLR